MAQIEIANRGVSVAVVGVLVAGATKAKTIAVGLGVLHAVRPSVDGKHGEVVAEAMLGGNAKPIEVGIYAVIGQSDLGEECSLSGVELGQEAALLGVTYRGCSGNVDGRVLFV